MYLGSAPMFGGINKSLPPDKPNLPDPNGI